jgi:hypothetical protein
LHAFPDASVAGTLPFSEGHIGLFVGGRCLVLLV